MFVEVRPTPDWVALQPDPKRPPSFDIMTSDPAFVALELATSPEPFYDESGRTDANFARITTDTAPGASRGTMQTKLSADSLSGLPSYRYRVDTGVWSRFAGQTLRLYYRALASSDETMTDPVSSYLTPPARTPGGPGAAPYTDWMPFLEILKDSVIECYHRRPGLNRDRSKTPWLAVSKNNLVTMSTGNPVTLRGINLPGMEYRKIDDGRFESLSDKTVCPAGNFREAAGISQTRLTEIRGWGANVIRLTLNQRWAVNGINQEKIRADAARRTYLTDIDTIVDMCASLGVYVILTLQWTDDTTPMPSEKMDRVQIHTAMPDNLSMIFWSMLAARYQDDPAVLFDICSEPHVPKPPDAPGKLDETKWYVGRATISLPGGLTALWKEWASVLEATIHAIHPKAVLFASGAGGLAYASDLRAMPLTKAASVPGDRPVPLPNIIYSAHYYPRASDKEGLGIAPGTVTWQVNGKDPNPPEPVANPDADWNRYLGGSELRAAHPVFFGEWGPLEYHSDESRQAWARAFKSYLRGFLKDGADHQGLAGWTAWGWSAKPYIVNRNDVAQTSSCKDFDARPEKPALTTWGQLVKDALSTP